MLLYQDNVKADESGVIRQKIVWNNINNKINFLTVYAMVRENDKNGKVLYDADGSFSMATSNLMKNSILMKVPNNKSAVMVEGSSIKPSESKSQCPNCDKPVTVEELKKIFTQADDSTLKKAAEAYTKYMKKLGMNTCWNKAHFFAQARVESGENFRLKKGESMNYSADDLFKGRWDNEKKIYKTIFSYYRNNQESYTDGRTSTHDANEITIANKAYGSRLGNRGGDDGWIFRGKGCIQLTGRSNYTKANAYTLRFENKNIIENSDIVATDIQLAVLTSMAYFHWNKMNEMANGQSDTKALCIKVGNDVKLSHGKTNHGEKQEAFKTITSKIFMIEKCKWGEISQQITNSDLKISNGIAWLETLQIPQERANEKANYKVLYSQDGDRTSVAGENVMDCSELVCRYLQKIEWSSQVKNLNTSALYLFANSHSNWLEKHDNISYNPQVGDIFLWKNDAGTNGHTGVVIGFDFTTNIVTTIEAIHFPEKPEGATASIDLQGVVKLKWKKSGFHLLGHPTVTKRYTASSCKFYTPKIHYSKQHK